MDGTPRHSTEASAGARADQNQGAGQRYARQGSVYILVLATSLLVAAIGLSTIALARISIRQARSRKDQAEAMSLAASAVQAAIAQVNMHSTWRLTYDNGAFAPEVPFWNGTISWKFVDEDGDLSDDWGDPVTVYGIGRVGESVWVYSVALSGSTPLEVLNTCIHSSQQLQINAGASLKATGAPASTNGNFSNDGTLYGSIDALTQSGGGTVTGDVNIPSPPKDVPRALAFTTYAAKATVLADYGNFDTVVLTPGVNEYGGGLNSQGIYYINARHHGLVIRNSRLHGTLVIDAHGKTVRIESNVLMQNYRADCPVLIINGNCELTYDSSGAQLDENGEGHNFNPPGAPYQGDEDTDQSDQYPSEIQGLVHVTGNLLLKQTSRIRGVVICEGAVTVKDQPEIYHSAAVAGNLPEGYASSEGELAVCPGTWQREQAP